MPVHICVASYYSSLFCFISWFLYTVLQRKSLSKIKMQITLYFSKTPHLTACVPYIIKFKYVCYIFFICRNEEEKLKRPTAPEKLTFKERQRLFSLASSG